MPRFLGLVGKFVEVQYRAGDVDLPATGILVADSGDSIHLERRFVQDGSEKTLRWEIPYSSIMQVKGLALASAASAPSSSDT